MRFLLLLLLSSTAFASHKPAPDYQDAVLKNFHSEVHGQHCTTSGDSSGSVNATTDSSGNTNGSVNGSSASTTNCSPNVIYYYVVTSGEHTYTLTPGLVGGKKAGAILSLGYSRLFTKDSCLYGQLPGTPVKMRSDGGTIFVKVGERESSFKLISVE